MHFKFGRSGAVFYTPSWPPDVAATTLCKVSGKRGSWIATSGTLEVGPAPTRWQAAQMFLIARETPTLETLEVRFRSEFTEAQRHHRPPQMTEAIARQVYGILVEECGAPGNDLNAFFQAYTAGGHARTPTEWRFSGALGFGGKFWSSWTVSCYPEDENVERRRLILNANLRLAELFRREVLPSL